MRALRTLFWIVFLIFMLLYIAAIFLTRTIGHNPERSARVVLGERVDWIRGRTSHCSSPRALAQLLLASSGRGVFPSPRYGVAPGHLLLRSQILILITFNWRLRNSADQITPSRLSDALIFF